MSLSNPEVYSMLLRGDFVLGWKNIRREDYVGDSLGYSPKQACVGTTNGAGAHNVQIFVLSPAGVVLHALPGFWHPEDLAHELRHGKLMWRLWKDKSRTVEQKRAFARRLQLSDLRYQSAEMYARSDWQGFDMTVEGLRLAAKGTRDTFERSGDGKVRRTKRGAPILKPLNVLVHARMAERPFVRFADFDIARFIDYGRKFYDNNAGVDGRGRKLK